MVAWEIHVDAITEYIECIDHQHHHHYAAVVYYCICDLKGQCGSVILCMYNIGNTYRRFNGNTLVIQWPHIGSSLHGDSMTAH